MASIFCLCAPAGLVAQPAQSAPPANPASAAGTVAGHVSNAGTGKYLASVEVRDRQSNRAVITDSDGSYELYNLPAGERTLVFTYGGLDTQTVVVTVVAGQRVTEDIALTSAAYGSDYDKQVVQLEKFVVSGDREGRMASVAQQKASDVMVSVLSSDEFPNVAGANLGDFLRNIPGIDVMDNGSDPRNFMIRGMDSQMSGVTSDGLRMANAVGTDPSSRSFDMDQISIQNYETIEVYKTPTAAMEAASGAGSINLVSKSAFDLKAMRTTFSAGLTLDSMNTHLMRVPSSSGNEFAIRPSGNLQWQNSFLRNTLGVTFTANYNDMSTFNKSASTSKRTSFDSNATLGVYYPVTDDSGIFSRSFTYSMGPGVTRRSSFSLNFDYKLSPFAKLYSKNQINTSYISSGQQSLGTSTIDPSPSTVIYEGGPSTGVLPGWTPYSVTVVAGANDIRANTIQDAAASKSNALATTNLEILNKIGNTPTFSLGGEYKRNGWKINVDAGVSLSTNHYTTPNGFLISRAQMWLRGIDYRIDTPAGSSFPIITQLNGPSIYDLANYVSRASSSSTGAVGTIPGTGRNVPASGGGYVVIPGVSTGNGVSGGNTYPAVHYATGNYAPFMVSNGRWLATKDKVSSAKFDIRRNFPTSFPMYIQVGGLAQDHVRQQDRNGQASWYFNGTTEELQQVLEAVKSPDLNGTFGPYQPVPYFSMAYVNQYFREHPEKFTQDVITRLQTEGDNNKYSREKILGGYGMFNIMLFRHLNLLLGVRYEQTDQSGRGPVVNNDAPAERGAEMLMDYVRGFGYADITSAYNDTVVNPITGVSGQSLVNNFTVNQEQAIELTRLRYTQGTADNKFGDWFPNVQAYYNFTPNLKLRASYNKSITRQKFDQLLPGYSVTTDSNGVAAVTMNNPSLKPIYFNNYDIALELYTKRGGLISVGYFYKDVKNYTMNLTETILPGVDYGYDFSEYIGGTIYHPTNVGGQKNWGIEFSLSQHLEVLSSYLRDFQVYGTYTYMDGKMQSSYGGTSDMTGLTQLPPWMPVPGLISQKFKINLSYNRGRVSATLSYSWTARYSNGGPYRVNTNGDGPDSFGYSYIEPRGTFDASLQYAFYRNYKFYIEGKNITNAPVRASFINSKWIYSYNLYGAFIYFGVKGSF